MTREIDADFAELLESEATTLCRCWRVKRRDGAALGFTDHDRPLTFVGITFEPESGFQGTAMERGLGLSRDNAEAAGILRSAAVTEADIAAGLYEGAEVTQWLVDWTRPSQRNHKLFVGLATEIRRGEIGFEMELGGLSGALDRPLGRGFQRRCDAELGDGRCGVALTGKFRETGTVTAVLDARRFLVEGFDAPEDPRFFEFGRLEWMSGGNDGGGGPVRNVLTVGDQLSVDLWRAPGFPVAVGDAFRLFAGCDKRSETCREKFDNLLNFRGFPFIPGEDWATSYPSDGEVHDGGSLFR
ncbi:MAG: DUF2163 domain-containing protein [Pseudomonadota bacterium]